MEYYLYPPFLLIEPQNSFADAWEYFCCRLLNLEHQTNKIYVRKPPDRGVDLFWPDEGIAYQCKAVENGTAGGLQLAHVKASFKQALDYQAQIGWRDYILCTNVDLTGPQQEKLLQMYPGLKIQGYSYWMQLCRRFHEQIADRFQVLIPIAAPHIQQAVQAINKRYLHNYLPIIQEYPPTDLIHILLYSNRYKHIFEFSIPVVFTAHDILLMLRELFELPGPKYIQEHHTVVSLEYSLHVNNKEVAPQQKLSELQVNDRPIITLWKTIVWSENHRTLPATTDLESTFQKPVSKSKGSLYGSEKLAVEQYIREMDRAVNRAITRFSPIENSG